MATWRKVLVEGLDLTGADVTNNEKDLVIGAGLSLGGIAATSAATQESNNILLGADGDVTIAINIDGQTDLGSSVVGSDLILVADVSDSNSIKKTTVADIIGSVDTGVTSITSGNGLTANSSATGAVTINLDTSTLSTQTVSSTTEFIVSNSGDTEGVAAASNIELEVFSNTNTAFIDLAALSVGAEGTASGDGSIAYNSSTGEFTYTPPDLSSYSTTDRFASAFSYTGGSAAGPTGTLTVTGGSDVSFGAIPSASNTASGVVTTSVQSFAGKKTFTGEVIVQGNFTVSGTTTTIDTETLTVEDANIILADPSTAYSTDDTGAGTANSAADRGGITLVSHHGTVESHFAAATWSSSGNLTGWQVRDTSDYSGATDVAQDDFPLSIMEFNSASPGSGDNAAGIGSFRFDTTSGELYLRTA